MKFVLFYVSLSCVDAEKVSISNIRFVGCQDYVLVFCINGNVFSFNALKKLITGMFACDEFM